MVTRPRWVVALTILLVLLAVPGILRLHLDTDVRSTLPPDMAQALARHNALFGTADRAFLLVQAAPGSRDTLLAFAAALRERLLASPLLRSVEYGYAHALFESIDRVSLDYAPLFVTPAQLEDFVFLLTPQGLQAQLHKTLLQLSAMGTGLQDQWLMADPLQLRRFAVARLASLRGTFRVDPTSPFFLSPDGAALLLTITGQPAAHDLVGAQAIVALIEDSSAALRAQPSWQGITVQATGGYFFATESERIIRQDMIVSVHLTILSIGLLLVWTLRRWGVLVYGILPTVLSIVLALGVFAALRPTLNALTLGCVASLVGFGMDFSVHVLQRAFLEQARGLSQADSLRLAITDTGGGLLLAALTTMACFLAFCTSSQAFLHDLGILAAASMGLSCLLSVTFLPALLSLCKPPRHSVPPRTLGLLTWIAAVARWPRSILGGSLGLALGALLAVWLWPPQFATDLRSLHAADSPTLRVQENIATVFGGAQEPLLLLLEEPTETRALQGLARLQDTLQGMVTEGHIAAVTSPAMLYPDPAAQQAVLTALQRLDLSQWRAMLVASLETAGFDVSTFSDYIERVLHALSLTEPVDLERFRALGFDSVLRPLLAHDDAGAVGVAMLFPRHDLWTREARDVITQRLSAALETHGLRGTLSGLYTISAASAALIKADFSRITLLAFLGVGLIVVIYLRHLWQSALVLLPVACGMLWAAGVLALSGFTLNIMNLAMLPMLLGTASDYGIYLMHRFTSQGRSDTQDALRISGLGIMLSALTTLEGFGTLALSVNRGIASVGWVALISISTCLLAALATLPALVQRRGRPLV